MTPVANTSKDSAPVQAATGSGRLHIDFVDSLRALAALHVVIHHILFYFWPPWGAPPRNLLVRAANDFFSYGRYAVAVFIVLSGFCLALPVVKEGRMRHSFGQFIRRRARRILPPYYAALILSLLFIAATGTALSETIWDESVKLTWTGVIANSLALQNWFGTHAFGQINYVFWSVAVEWHIYFFFPLILWLWTQVRSRWIATLLIVPATTALGWLWKDGHWAYQNIQFLGLFAVGMFAAHISLTKPDTKTLRTLSLGLSLLGAMATVIISAQIGWMRATQVWPLLDLLVGVTTAALLIYLVHTPGGLLRKLLSASPLVAVGIFSYSIYLVHAPIIHGLWLLSTNTLGLSFFPSLALMLGLGVPLIIALAYGFHRLFEKPFLNAPVTPRSAPSHAP